MRKFRDGALAVLALLPLALPTPATAQTEVREHVTAYAPAYFASSEPPSALEMVNLLPGFNLVEADTTVRGYSGAQGNVLIDGRPPASKQDKLSDTLKRIPAAGIDHIELMRPGTAGIDMQGYPLIANIVRKISTAPRMRVEIEDEFFRHGQSAPKLAGEISIGKTRVLDISAQMYRNIKLGAFGDGPRNYYKQDFVTPILLADFSHPKYENIWTLLGTYRQPLWGGAVRINGLYRDARTSGKSDEQDYFPKVIRKFGAEREVRFANEFGLQYTHGLWTGGEGELIAIRRGNGEVINQSNFDPAGETRSSKKDHTGETILRLVERQRGQGWNTEAGVEGTLNTLDNTVSFQQLGKVIVLPAADVRLQEQRAEGFLNGTWHILPVLALEAGARYEMSFFKQRGDSVLTETLGYLKPRAELTWNVLPTDELRLSYAREASQLNFGNFVTNVQVASLQIQAGNVNLVPYTEWKAELTWEHRFQAGSVVLSARDEAIKDTWDQIGFVSSTGTFDALGNVGPGRRHTLTANVKLPLDFMYLDGFTLQASGNLRYSHVIDPTTHERRRISNDVPSDGVATLTDDISSWNLRWGVTFTQQLDRWTYKFNEIQGGHEMEQVDVFIEYKPQPDWQIRFFGEDLMDRPAQNRVRYTWTGPRPTAPYFHTEWRPARNGPRFGLNIQRTFGN